MQCSEISHPQWISLFKRQEKKKNTENSCVLFNRCNWMWLNLIIKFMMDSQRCVLVAFISMELIVCTFSPHVINQLKFNWNSCAYKAHLTIASAKNEFLHFYILFVLIKGIWLIKENSIHIRCTFAYQFSIINICNIRYDEAFSPPFLDFFLLWFCIHF